MASVSELSRDVDFESLLQLTVDLGLILASKRACKSARIFSAAAIASGCSELKLCLPNGDDEKGRVNDGEADVVFL